MDLINIAIELVIGFVLLFIVTRIIGKTQLNQITPFDFISAMVMGELLGNTIYEEKVGILYVFYTLGIWTILMLAVEFTSQKFIKSRSFLEGNPDIIIRNGIIDRKVMKKNRLDLNTLLTLLRQQNVFSIQDVAYAILEPNGALSVLKKSGVTQVTRDDLKLPLKTVDIPTTLISDGKILWDNLRTVGLNINRLKEELDKKDYQDIDDIFYAEWSDSTGLFVQGYT